MDWADAVIRGDEPMPAPGTMEANNLASLAGKARWGKADPIYEREFKKYWYHNKEKVIPPPAEEEMNENYEDSTDDDSGEEDE
jgi:hypothetical protein